MRPLLAAILPLTLLAATSDQNLVSKTRERIKANQVKLLERKMDLIGWAKDIPTALQLAKEHERPVFLLVSYGNIATGRTDGDSFVFRAVGLSSDSIISTINEYYVPVYRSWDDLAANPEDQKEFRRITEEAIARKIPTADVRVFILSPDGHPMPAVLSMSDPYRMLRGLLQVVIELKTVQGKALLPPALQSVPPDLPKDALVMHSIMRGTGGGSWRSFPAEGWTTLGKEQWSRLLPGTAPQAGVTWNVDPKIASAILTNFYPATEENSRKDRNFIQKIAWKARVLSVEDGVALARIDASMKARRSFYPDKEPVDHLDVKVEGFLRFPIDRSDVYTLALVTTDAFYEDEEFLGSLEDIKEMPKLQLPEAPKP